jgi:hypothetical protein
LRVTVSTPLARSRREPEGFGTFYERLVPGWFMRRTRDPALAAGTFAAAQLSAGRY